MSRQRKDHKLWLGYAIVIILSLSLYFSGLYRPADHQLLDSQFRILRDIRPTPANMEVAIVGIDESSFRQYKEPLTLWHPHFAAFFDAMGAAAPAAVGVDMVFPDRSYEFLVPGYDLKLLQALRTLRKQLPVVLAQTVDDKGGLRPLFAPIVSFVGKDSIGVPLVRPESDGVVRQFMTAVGASDTPLPTFTGRLAQWLGLPGTSGYIDYSAGEPLGYVPFHQVLEWSAQGDISRLKQTFANKLVLLGAVLPFEDRHSLPVALAEWEPGNHQLPGVLIHAQAARTLAGHGVIEPLAPIQVVMLTILASLVWWVRPAVKWGIPILVTGGVLFSLFSLWLLADGHVLPLSVIFFAGLSGWLLRLLYEAHRNWLEKRWLNASFAGYVSPNVMDQIIAGNIHPNMQGERTHVCVLFSDIRNFTTRSEHESPEKIISLLNDYFDEMTEIVHSCGGTVDKFIGDGLMAFFGAPNKTDKPADNAFKAAQIMLQRVDRLNEQFTARHIDPIQVGIGLHVGEVVVGHVGSANRHEYTVIGDTVNTTARLEGLTKALGYPLLVTADVAGELDYPEGLISLGEHQVKGRSAVPVYGWQQPTEQ